MTDEAQRERVDRGARPSGMRLVRLLLAALLTASGLLLVAPAPSFACSCALPGPRAHVEQADVVLLGTLVGIELPDMSGTWSSTDPATYTFEVDAVLKGEAGATTEVVSAVSGASCGLEGMEEGRDYLVHAVREGERLEANLCGGTGPASDRAVEKVQALTGASTSPVGPGNVNEPRDDDRAAVSSVPGWAWAGGAVALVLAAAVAVRRRLA